MIRPAQTLLAIWATTSSINAFTPATRRVTSSASRLVVATPSTTTALNLQETAPEGTKLVSGRKEITYDGTRFFETGVEDEDCVPSQEFCIVDPSTAQQVRLTVEEKELMFLDALQSYYVSGRQVMEDADFDSLREDLAWNGSEVVNLNRKEVQYLDAMQAYNKGEPTLNDVDFDKLRDDLREDKSSIAVSKEPKCYIDTGICTVTYQKDNFRNNLLYLPSISILAILWLGIGYEIVGGRINPIVLAAFGTPVIVTAAKAITDNLLFPNNLVAYGPCPTCEAENRIYFGDILGVEGFDKTGKVKCKSCKGEIIVQKRSLRANTLPKND